jgi:hypothetical protein
MVCGQVHRYLDRVGSYSYWSFEVRLFEFIKQAAFRVVNKILPREGYESFVSEGNGNGIK